ncbi:hypothetical protein [Flaviflexus equikiangi]|uniref:hypothetical protein n=1 Tax=Flaviflexus equikiangi TaxID=2758573 RepID=UPI0015F4FC3B|nr:hypothetical protein [Flaviflexus equikiangi]
MTRGALLSIAIAFMLMTIGTGVVLAASEPAIFFLGLLFLVTVLLIVRRPILASVVVLLYALPFSRPNLFGDEVAFLGLTFALVAVFPAVLEDLRARRTEVSHGLSLASLMLWLTISYAWIFLRAIIINSDKAISVYIASFTLTFGTILAANVVLADARRARIFGKALVYLTAVCSLSFLITMLVWGIVGIGGGLVGVLPFASGVDIYFPMSTTLGTQEIWGSNWPRLTGYAREPGLMGMWFAFTYFLVPMLGLKHDKLCRTLLVIGILVTFSVASAAIFISVWIAVFLYSSIGSGFSVQRKVLRLFAGTIAIGVGVWSIIYSPVIGLSEKVSRDPGSVAEREGATRAGFRALFESPLLGGGAVDDIGGLNLVASIAAYGAPFAVAIGLALLMPLRSHPNKRFLLGPLMVLFLTVATAQPPLDSVWIYVSAVAAIHLAGHSLPAANPRSA